MYNRMNEGHVCDRLSHLIYRLHRSTAYEHKFLLVTRIFDFKNEFLKSEDLSRRLLTSVDPEFIYLLLRSSTIFKIIGLEISNLLMCNRKNSKHMRKLIVYVTEILETNMNRKDFVYDSSTKEISEHMGEYDIVWFRLIYQLLACLERLSEYLGSEYVYSYFIYVKELNESVEYLLNDMFDVSLQTEGGLGGTGVKSISTTSDDFNDFRCELCELLRKNEFKDEAMKLEELYKDLDSLAKAHLEELDIEEIEDANEDEFETDTENNNKEDKDEVKNKDNKEKENNNNKEKQEIYREKNEKEKDNTNIDNTQQKNLKVTTLTKHKESNLLDILERLGDSFLEELREKSKDVCLYLSCIVLLMEILPKESKLRFVQKCLDSNNFDVIKSLLTKIISLNCSTKEGKKRELEGLNELLYKYCVRVLDSNMTRDNVVFLLGFVKEYIENREKKEKENNRDNNGNEKDFLDLLKVTKRCEIEIYLSLEEVFRKEEVVSSTIPFETMEVVMSLISNIEDPFENMDQFFSIFHRTVQLLFDYFDHLYENKDLNNLYTNSQVNKHKSSVVRLLSCWMTLEPMHFQSQFLQKLTKILTVINEMDFIWLLPTFNYIEVSDLYSIDGFLEKLISVVYEVSRLNSDGEVSRNTIRMSCELLERLHLDPLVDYKRMLKIFGDDINGCYEYNKDDKDEVKNNENKEKENNNNNKERKEENEKQEMHRQKNEKEKENNRDNEYKDKDKYKKFNLVEYKQYFERKLDKGVFSELNKLLDVEDRFTPRCPLEYLLPICINLDENNNESYKVMSTVMLELLFKLIEKSKIRFVKEFLEGRFDLEGYVDDLGNEYETNTEEYELLVHVTLATVSVCMGRVYERSFAENYGNGMMVFLLSLNVFFLLHTSPRTSREYLDEENEFESFYSYCRLSVLLMQNYPLFGKLFNYSVKKVCLLSFNIFIQSGLKIPAPRKEDFEKIFEEGMANEEDLVLSEFFSMYTYNL